MFTVGVLGAGQLGRMLALAGYPLGLKFRFFDPAPATPAGQLAQQIEADYGDREALRRFAAGLSVVTYEFENVPVETTRFLAQHVPVFPPPEALEAAQDRVQEKTLFRQLGLPTPAFEPVDSRADLDKAIAQIGLPAVLKKRRLGYDGKGQAVLQEPSDADRAWQALGGASLSLEAFVPFEREMSIIAVRGRDGTTAFYPLVENHHRDGLLRLSLVPAPVSSLQSLAEEYAARMLTALNYVGVLAIELFQQDGQLIVNEMAPRVHNSGHWTIEGAETSQFANHLRAGLGWPLGPTTPIGHSAMLNLIGTLPDTAQVLTIPNAHMHLYGKAPRPGRKLGHITVRADDERRLAEQLDKLKSIVDF